MFSCLQIKRRAPGKGLWLVLFWWGFMIWLLRVTFFLLYRVRYHGRANVPRSGPILFVANHQSNFDPAIAGILVRDRPFKGIARESLFHSKILGAYMRGFGAISIKRGESDTIAIRKSIDELSRGGCVMMFPEGTRTKDGNMGKFQRGFWLLMKKSNATVLPMGIDGAFDAYPIGGKLKLWGHIEIVAGQPIQAELLLELGEKEGTALVRNQIMDLQMICKSNISRHSKN